MHERHGKVSKAWNAGSYATMIERQPALTARAKRRIVPVSDETPAQRAARSAAAVSQIRFGQAAASAVPVQQKRAPGSRGPRRRAAPLLLPALANPSCVRLSFPVRGYVHVPEPQ